jgi:hypothetical protein
VSTKTRKLLSKARLGKNIKKTNNYRTLHARLCSRFPKKGVCERCQLVKKTYYAKIKGHEYTDNREDYYELCQKCHMNYDRGGIPLVAEHKMKLSDAHKVRWQQRKLAGLGKYNGVANV